MKEVRDSECYEYSLAMPVSFSHAGVDMDLAWKNLCSFERSAPITTTRLSLTNPSSSGLVASASDMYTACGLISPSVVCLKL